MNNETLIEKLEALDKATSDLRMKMPIFADRDGVVRVTLSLDILNPFMKASAEFCQLLEDLRKERPSEITEKDSENKRLKAFIYSIFAQLLNEFNDPFMGDDNESHVKTMKHCYGQIKAFADKVPDWGKWDYAGEAWREGYGYGKKDAALKREYGNDYRNALAELWKDTQKTALPFSTRDCDAPKDSPARHAIEVNALLDRFMALACNAFNEIEGQK